MKIDDVWQKFCQIIAITKRYTIKNIADEERLSSGQAWLGELCRIIKSEITRAEKIAISTKIFQITNGFVFDTSIFMNIDHYN